MMISIYRTPEPAAAVRETLFILCMRSPALREANAFDAAVMRSGGRCPRGQLGDAGQVEVFEAVVVLQHCIELVTLGQFWFGLLRRRFAEL